MTSRWASEFCGPHRSVTAHKTNTPQRWALGRVLFSLFISKQIEGFGTSLLMVYLPVFHALVAGAGDLLQALQIVPGLHPSHPSGDRAHHEGGCSRVAPRVADPTKQFSVRNPGASSGPHRGGVCVCPV